jgi:hypothetical protein
MEQKIFFVQVYSQFTSDFWDLPDFQSLQHEKLKMDEAMSL